MIPTKNMNEIMKKMMMTTTINKLKINEIEHQKSLKTKIIGYEVKKMQICILRILFSFKL